MICQTYRAITYMSCYCTNCLPLYKALHPVRVLMCDVFLFICSWYRTLWILSESLVGYIVCIYSLLLGHLYCMHKQTFFLFFFIFLAFEKTPTNNEFHQDYPNKRKYHNTRSNSKYLDMINYSKNIGIWNKIQKMFFIGQ